MASNKAYVGVMSYYLEQPSLHAIHTNKATGRAQPSAGVHICTTLYDIIPCAKPVPLMKIMYMARQASKQAKQLANSCWLWSLLGDAGDEVSARTL